MSTTLGKSAGIALLLAAGLIAALFAAGVFSALPASAAAHEVETLRVHQGTSGGDPRLTLVPNFDPEVTNYTVNFTIDDATSTPTVFVVARANASDTTTVVGVTATGATVGSDGDAEGWKFAGRVSTNDDTNDLTGTLIKVQATAAGGESRVYNIQLRQPGEITNSKVAGKEVRLTLRAAIRARVNGDITLGMGSFGLPKTIDENHVTIDTGERSGNPRDVTVSGSNVVLTLERLDNTKPNDAMENQIGAGTSTDVVTITVSSRAGITNPTAAGTHLVTIQTSDSPNDGGVDARFVATVERNITVSPKSGGKSVAVTVSGTGFSSGGNVTVFRDVDEDNTFSTGDVTLGTAPVTKGAFSFETSAIDQTSKIQVIDYDGNLAAESKTFTITASIKVTPAQVSPAENLTVELVDWTQGEEVTHIRFGGANGEVVAASGNADATGEKATAQVPQNARLGNLKVEALVGSTSKASASVTVRAHTLTISPDTVVPGQEVTIQGSGFGSGVKIDSLTFGGGANVYEGASDLSKPSSDTNGNITITVRVPDDVKPGSREVKATARNNRLGTESITVTKPKLTVTPDKGLRGTMVTLAGEGFTANDSVQIQYDRFEGDTATPRTITTANVGSTGRFTASFEVPSFARIGKTQKITVNSQLNDDFAAETVNHSTPKPELSVNPARAAVGATVSIGGLNFAGFAPVADLKIDDRDVKPVPTPTTKKDGSITMDGILVPQLDPGSYTVRLEIAGEVVTRFITVTDAPVSTAPADVFEPLVEAENLTVVWHYDNATGTWTSYSPTVPAALNDLETVATGTIVWVQVSEAATFQGKSLVAGWNLITLN